MKRVTIEEYDEQGRLKSRRVEEDGVMVQGYWPIMPACTCGTSIWCQYHQPYYRQPHWYVTTGSSTDNTVKLSLTNPA